MEVNVEELLTSLSKRQTMLLLTVVTFGGQESLRAFEHLAGEDAELLRHRAQQMLEVPREQRIPLLVQELKRLVTAKRGYLWTAEPDRIAEVLKDERGALVEVLLRALPAPVADAVRAKLHRKDLLLRTEVKPQVLEVVRWKLEEILARAVPARAQFRFSDVLLLHARELLAVCDRLGTRGLANAVAGLPEDERTAFLEALPPGRRALMQRAATKAAARALGPDDARTLIATHAKSPSDAVRSAGAHRLARAALAQSPEFAQRVIERNKGELGSSLLRWYKEERRKGVPRGDAGRAEVVAELERLAEAQVIERPIRPFSKPLPPPPERLAPRSGKVRRDDPEHRPLELPAVRLPEKRSGEHRMPPRRDPIAERAARKAGAASAEARRGASGDPMARRDPIAERSARRAGVLSSHAPGVPPPSSKREGAPRPASGGQGKILRGLPRPPARSPGKGPRSK